MRPNERPMGCYCVNIAVGSLQHLQLRRGWRQRGHATFADVSKMLMLMLLYTVKCGSLLSIAFSPGFAPSNLSADPAPSGR